MPQRTPLLAQDGHGETPALSGLPESAAHEESALSRLIAESTPPSFLMPQGVIDETMVATTPSPFKRSSGTTIVAGTLICLQWGFLWGAYFSESWMDSHLQVYLAWQQKFLPVLDTHTDVVIVQTSVFTLATNLEEDKSYFSLAGLWFCSVILPCIFMIVCPIWILTDYSVPPRPGVMGNNAMTNIVGPFRRWLELTIRLSWLVIFIILTLDVAISGIELEWDFTDLKIQNELKGPFISYVVGSACGLLAVVVLRMPYLEHIKLLRYTAEKPTQNNNIQQSYSLPESPPPQALRAPPANAFQLPWLSSLSANGDGSDVTEPLLGTPSNQQQPTQSTSLTPYQGLVAFQLGILAFLLWIPSVALVQFRVLYDGLIVDLVKVKAFNMYIWQLPLLVWNTGVKAGTDKWMLILLFSIIFTFVLIIPLVAHAVAAMVWMVRKEQTRAKLTDILTLLQPAMCQIPFAMGLLVTVGSFVDIGGNIDAGICVKIESLVQNQCMITGGVIFSGCWFLVAQAITLEAFVFVTLRWTVTPKPTSITV
jgi:hypothetical protein